MTKLPEPTIPASSLVDPKGIMGNLYSEEKMKQYARDVLEEALHIINNREVYTRIDAAYAITAMRDEI